jgi:hypothetical protein
MQNFDASPEQIRRLHDVYNQHLADYSVIGLGWQAFSILRDCLLPENLATAEWKNYKSGMGFIAPDFWTETSYEDCLCWRYYPLTYTLEFTLFDGDNMTGVPENPRCCWEFKLTTECADVYKKLIAPAMIAKLRRKAKEQYEQELQKIHDEAINKIFEKMFS